ncbi:MAG: hypothetical protein AAB969_00085, partial [Patescibacteria group bacterium]
MKCEHCKFSWYDKRSPILFGPLMCDSHQMKWLYGGIALAKHYNPNNRCEFGEYTLIHLVL